MAKYINAVEAAEKVAAATGINIADLVNVFAEVPAADVVSRAVYNQVRWERDVAAVPVVRCKECIHSYEDIDGLVCGHGACVDCIVRRDFFCADGEKMGGSQ